MTSPGTTSKPPTTQRELQKLIRSLIGDPPPFDIDEFFKGIPQPVGRMPFAKPSAPRSVPRALLPRSFTPKAIPDHYRPKLEPDRSLIGHDAAQPIWGHAYRLLVDGTRWPGKFVSVDPGPSWKPRQVEYYPGEFAIEPHPLVSSNASTMQILRAMYRAGWSLDQVIGALSDPRHRGGLSGGRQSRSLDS